MRLFLVSLLALLVAFPAHAQKKPGATKKSKTYKTKTVATRTIKVANLTEFLAALGPNRTIEITAAEIDVSKAPANRNSRFYRYSEEFDGLELVISNVQNLTIRGGGTAKTHLITRPKYGDVLVFEKCTNVMVEKLRAGHGPEKGQCVGGVFNFINSKNAQVRNCTLYGSGMQGIEMNGSENLKVSETVIEECTYSIMTLTESRNAEFTDCVFRQNQEFDMVNLSDSHQVIFRRCTFEGNMAGGDDYALFSTSNTTNVLLDRCTLRNNRFKYFGTSRSVFTLTDLTLENNTFGPDDFRTR